MSFKAAMLSREFFIRTCRDATREGEQHDVVGDCWPPPPRHQGEELRSPLVSSRLPVVSRRHQKEHALNRDEEHFWIHTNGCGISWYLLIGNAIFPNEIAAKNFQVPGRQGESGTSAFLAH